MTVVSEKTADNTYRVTRVRSSRYTLFTCIAVPERVVDGDTLVVETDCGFNTKWSHRVRLRGIDTPKLFSRKGQQARQFVVEALAEVHFVIIVARTLGRYGRILGDVFYLPGHDDPQQVLKKGFFLNQQLLDEGLADPYS